MVVTSRQLWIAVALMAFGLCPGCAPQLPDGELACGEQASVAQCPESVPVCEQRPGDGAAFCYRVPHVRSALPPRFGQHSEVATRVRLPASRSFRLIEQSVARADGTMLAAGR